MPVPVLIVQFTSVYLLFNFSAILVARQNLVVVKLTGSVIECKFSPFV